MTCKHKLSYKFCLICFRDAHVRAGIEITDHALLKMSRVVQAMATQLTDAANHG